MTAALRLTLSWLTVLPVRGPERVDRAVAGPAIALAPLVGALLGAAATGVAWLVHDRLPATLVGLLTVAVLLSATRGMHIDGLADTADGLGSYAAPERAREIMRSGSAGPFGVAAVVLSIGVQAAAFGALADAHRWLALGCAVAAGRVAVVMACRTGWPAAEGSGFGAMVAETQSTTRYLGWSAVLWAASACALPDGRWAAQGTLAAIVPLLAAWMLARHCVRRFGGMSGDVLGAAVELTVGLYAVIAAFGAG
ncbi:MAG: adenosylcobinamide-GDP ribazoletransferase [Mycobacteriaceae bacterium]|nr:adenosylcobinamide-GDP ribazoletransferase [Mycobacteriaceae bacterium]